MLRTSFSGLCCSSSSCCGSASNSTASRSPSTLAPAVFALSCRLRNGTSHCHIRGKAAGMATSREAGWEVVPPPVCTSVGDGFEVVVEGRKENPACGPKVNGVAPKTVGELPEVGADAGARGLPRAVVSTGYSFWDGCSAGTAAGADGCAAGGGPQEKPLKPIGASLLNTLPLCFGALGGGTQSIALAAKISATTEGKVRSDETIETFNQRLTSSRVKREGILIESERCTHLKI
jgi:hypothetical protein